MGGYHLSLQEGLHNRLDVKSANAVKAGKTGSIGRDDAKRSKRSELPRDMFGFGVLPSKRVASQQSLEGMTMLQQEELSPPRHSTACCDGLSLQRELSTERRLSSKVHSSDSFRSDDSDHLALWEEQETLSTGSDRDGWMRLTATQSPRWLDAMTKLAPWRSSPVHPRAFDTPRVSLDRKPSTRSLHETTKSWYSKKKWGPKLVRQSGELNSAMVMSSAKWDVDSVVSDDGGSFSRMVEEDTRFSPSAVAWDISHRPEPAAADAHPRPRSSLSMEIPAEVMDGNVDVKMIANALVDVVKDCGDSPRSESIFDGHSEYASCRTFVEDELLPEIDSPDAKSDGELSMVDFVAPLFVKKEDSSWKGGEKRVSFSWEAGPKLRAEEVAPTTETPQPPPGGSSTPYETLREQYIMKSKSAPLDGLYVILPPNSSAKIPLPWEKEIREISGLAKSKSCNGELRRVNSSTDHRLFTKLRKSVFRTGELGDEYIESSSPRSILRGPDDGMSVPSSSNPSLRSDPDTPAFSTRPTSTSDQSMSSSSFDLNEGDYELTYNLNSSAACIIVESRRVSLSFRDFGPAQHAAETSEAVTSSVELVGCDGQLDSNALHSSPELWTATFSARYRESDMPASLCARESEFSEITSSPPMRQLAYLMSCEDEEELREQQQEQPPIAMQKSRSRNNGEFTARLAVMFSPLRLISSHEHANHGCFVATTVSPPHEEGGVGRSPAFDSTVKFLRPVGLHSSSVKSLKSKCAWANGEMAKSRSTKRRHSSDDPQTMMVSFSKAMKKILSKCSVKRSTSRRKPRTDSPPLTALSPPDFIFT